MDNHKDKATADIFKNILVTDLCDAFLEVAKLAGIILVSPIGTAGVERSFSSMNRLCNKLRQRLTPEHLSQLLFISQQGPEQISRLELTDSVLVVCSKAASHPAAAESLTELTVRTITNY